MRKIISKQKQEKKTKRNNLIVGMLLLGVMLFSVIGYSLMSKESETIQKIDYNGQIFVNSNGLWQTQLGDFVFSFAYSPGEMFIFNSELNSIQSYVDLPLYVYIEKQEDYAALNEIYRNLFYNNKIVQRLQYACLEGEECEGDYPIKDCSTNMIIIKENNSSKLYQKENCVFIEGERQDLTKIADSFILKIVGLE